MFDIIVILRAISIIGFIFANIVAGLFFKQFVPDIPIVIFALLFFFSFIVLKTDFVIWTFGLLKVKDENFEIPHKKYKKSANQSIPLKKVFNAKNILVLFKQLFFNTIYELFPVYIAWISLLGLLYLIRFLDFSPTDSFYQVATMFGIFLGVFQFFLQRHEEKIASKISICARSIEAIINEETSFNKFYESLSEGPIYNDNLKKWILRNTDPKLQALDSFKFLTENDNFVEVLSKIMRKSQSKSPILFNLTYPDSNKKFEVIETAAELDYEKRTELIEAYKNFFQNEETLNRITSKIHREIDIKEFSILILSNINIFYEIMPKFTNSKLRILFEEMTDLKEIPIMTNFESSSEFRNALHFEITRKMFNDILF